MELDWGDGDYGRTAELLAPAAEELVAVAGVAAGQTVIDVACGTGSVALAAARRGARVIAVDASPQLAERARTAAARAGLDVEVRVGRAEALPVPDGRADAALSSFGVIFSDARGLGEMVRVTRPGGVVALTTWLPEGAVARAGHVLRAALPQDGAPASRWHEPAWIVGALAEAGAGRITTRAGAVRFGAASPEAWLDEQRRHHPVWRFARRALGGDRWPEVQEAMLAELRAANEDPAAFRARSPYLVVRAIREAGATAS